MNALELLDCIEARSIGRGELFLVTIPADFDRERADLAIALLGETLAPLCRIHDIPLPIILTLEGVELRSLSEETLRAAGWVRAEEGERCPATT